MSAAQAVASPAAGSPSAPGLAGGRITRAEIVRAGRQQSPWEFVALGLAALRVMPGDAEVRFLLAAAYAKLMLRTAALEQLDRLPEGAGSEPGVLTLYEAARALPPDRVGVDELQRVLAGNLKAIGLRAGVALDEGAWGARAAGREHFRARSGDIVWRVPGETHSWERWGNQAEQAETVRLPHDADPAAATYPPMYIVEGVDPPWLLRKVYAATGGRNDGYAPVIGVVQADVDQFVDGLAQGDVGEVLTD